MPNADIAAERFRRVFTPPLVAQEARVASPLASLRPTTQRT